VVPVGPSIPSKLTLYVAGESNDPILFFISVIVNSPVEDVYEYTVASK
jgi:hypothetical protein